MRRLAPITHSKVALGALTGPSGRLSPLLGVPVVVLEKWRHVPTAVREFGSRQCLTVPPQEFETLRTSLRRWLNQLREYVDAGPGVQLAW